MLKNRYTERATTWNERQKQALRQIEEQNNHQGKGDFGMAVMGCKLVPLSKVVGQTIRFLPLREAEKGESIPFVRVKIHRMTHPGVGKDGKQFFMPVLCAKENYSRSCVLCEDRSSVYRELVIESTKDEDAAKQDWKAWRERRQNQVYLTADWHIALALDDQDQIIAVPFGANVRKKMEEQLTSRRGGDFTDWLTGIKVEVKTVASTFGGEEATIDFFPSEDGWPLLSEPFETDSKFGTPKWIDEIVAEDPQVFDRIEAFEKAMPDLRQFQDEHYQWSTPHECRLYTNDHIVAMLNHRADPQVLLKRQKQLYDHHGMKMPDNDTTESTIIHLGNANQPNYADWTYQRLMDECKVRTIYFSSKDTPEHLRKKLMECDQANSPEENTSQAQLHDQDASNETTPKSKSDDPTTSKRRPLSSLRTSPSTTKSSSPAKPPIAAEDDDDIPF